jgi:hypothetical protein
MAKPPPSGNRHRLAAALLCTAGLMAGNVARAQGLEQFQQKGTGDERSAVNQAIRQCVRLIQQKTETARVSIKGPCRKDSGTWSGVERLENGGGFRLRFSVTPADSSAGTLLSAIQGDAVRVFCTADTQGAITQFEDLKEGIRESFSSTGLCWPAGD